MEDCRRWAIFQPSSLDGIFGGLDAWERDRIRRAMRRQGHTREAWTHELIAEFCARPNWSTRQLSRRTSASTFAWRWRKVASSRRRSASC